MKKYFIMMAMLFTMVSGAFAEGNEATEVAEAQKYEFRINHRRLASALDMSKDQMEMSYDIIRELEQDMEFAKVIEKYGWVETGVLADGYYNDHSREHVFNG